MLSSENGTSDILQNCMHAASIEHTHVAFVKLPVGWVYSVEFAEQSLVSGFYDVLWTCESHNCLVLQTDCISSSV